MSAAARRRPRCCGSPASSACSGRRASAAGSSPICARRWSSSERWFDDREFVRLLELSQTLPGLNSVNLAVLAGDQVRGAPGAAVAGLAMTAAGRRLRPEPGRALRALRQCAGWMKALLGGAAAAAVGLLLATALRLGRAQFRRPLDLAILLVTAVAVGELRLPLRLGRAGGGRGRDLALPAASGARTQDPTTRQGRRHERRSGHARAAVRRLRDRLAARDRRRLGGAAGAAHGRRHGHALALGPAVQGDLQPRARWRPAPT